MWVEITEDDLLTAISGPELEAIRAAALGAGQADPVQPTIDQVTRKVRSYVAACADNELGTGNTIPDELMDDALALIIVRLMPRAAGLMIDASEVRRNAAKDAMTNLRAVSRCGMALEQPATVSSEVVVSPSPSIKANKSTINPCTTDGM
jgi:hypothetical protein